MMYDFRHQIASTRLVASKLPHGVTLFWQAGQSIDRNTLSLFAKTHPACPKVIEVVTGESVGLELHEDGKLLEWSPEYLSKRFCVITPTSSAPTATASA